MKQVKTKLTELFNKLTEKQLNDNDLSIYVHASKDKIISVGLIQHDASEVPHATLDYAYFKNEFDGSTDILCVKALKSKASGFDVFSDLYGMFLRDYFDKFIVLNSDDSNDYNFDYKRCLVSVAELN